MKINSDFHPNLRELKLIENKFTEARDVKIHSYFHPNLRQ